MCVVSRSPPKRVRIVTGLSPEDAVQSGPPRGATSWDSVPLRTGLRRSLLVSLSVVNISLLCFYLPFLVCQWKKLLLRRQP